MCIEESHFDRMCHILSTSTELCHKNIMLGSQNGPLTKQLCGSHIAVKQKGIVCTLNKVTVLLILVPM